MHVLILGGTQFIGHHVALELLAAGHQVTVFNRGQTPDELPTKVERLRGDRDAGPAGLQALAGRHWHACVDTCGYTARQVRASCTLLRGAVQRYVYISAVMAYGDPRLRPVRETQPLLQAVPEDVEEVDGETYGPLKATCEGIVQELFGQQGTRLRPQVVVGPMDPTSRYTYWLQRCRRGGPMLAPGDGSDHVQVVDVRDLARFTRTVIEGALGGAFNVAGPRLTWMDFLTMLGAQQPVWVPGDLLDAAELRFGELPLYRRENGPRASLMDICNDKAQAAGLVLTAPEQTAADTWAWCARMPPSPETLSPQREAELIALARG